MYTSPKVWFCAQHVTSLSFPFHGNVFVFTSKMFPRNAPRTVIADGHKVYGFVVKFCGSRSTPLKATTNIVVTYLRPQPVFRQMLQFTEQDSQESCSQKQRSAFVFARWSHRILARSLTILAEVWCDLPQSFQKTHRLGHDHFLSNPSKFIILPSEAVQSEHWESIIK